ncbi:MAG: hypothetical protein ABIJ09_27090 [Pseudomonadota bacterium]
MRMRVLLSLFVAAMMLGPGTLSVASAKSGKADKKAAKAAAKADAKADAKAMAKGKNAKVHKNAAKEKEAALAAVEELKKETEKATWNNARIERVAWLANAKNDEALKVMVERLKTKEMERAKLVKDHYEPIAAKAPQAEE